MKEAPCTDRRGAGWLVNTRVFSNLNWFLKNVGDHRHNGQLFICFILIVRIRQFSRGIYTKRFQSGDSRGISPTLAWSNMTSLSVLLLHKTSTHINRPSSWFILCLTTKQFIDLIVSALQSSSIIFSDSENVVLCPVRFNTWKLVFMVKVRCAASVHLPLYPLLLNSERPLLWVWLHVEWHSPVAHHDSLVSGHEVPQRGISFWHFVLSLSGSFRVSAGFLASSKANSNTTNTTNRHVKL